MDIRQELAREEAVCAAWKDQRPAAIMERLLDRVCPDQKCSDVDRAILGASIGG